jgi:hypothetical protein
VAEILIDRCTFRVVRRQGWSWGLSPERFIEDALKQLPDLLAAKLEGFFADDAESVYEAPLRIAIKLPPATFDKEFFSSSLTSLASISSLGAVPLEERLQRALCAALGKPPAIPPELDSLPSSKQVRFAPQHVDSTSPISEGEPLQRFLLLLAAKKELQRFLAFFSVQELEVWQAALDRGRQTTTIQEERTRLILEELEAALPPDKRSPITDRTTLLRITLLLAAETANKLRLPLADPHLWIALERLLPHSASADLFGRELPLSSDESSAASVVPIEPVEHPTFANPVPAVRPHSCAPAFSDPMEWSTQVHSALPFLLLGPLHRIGYFSTLSAVLDAAHLSDKAHLFAAALAYKVLDPPDRGWRRTSPVQHAAAVFAGMPRPLPDEALYEFSRLIATHTGPLDHWITDTVASGRDTSSPVLLRRAESEHLSGFFVFDPSGCFPLAWVDASPAAIGLLRSIGSPVVLVSGEASGPRVLKELDQAGLTFVTGVPPVRGEAWCPVMQGPSRLGWTNHAHPSSEFLVLAARMLEISSLEAASFWEQFGIARPALPRAKLPGLEGCITLAASVALGILAWQLWKERGRTTPQQALERLGDLDASVRFSGETLQVGLPRGRRHMELLDAGLLAPVRDVHWLRGRRLEFGLG